MQGFREFSNKELLASAESDWSKVPFDYLGILENWKKFYPEEQIFIGFHDDIKSQPEHFLKTVFDFLGGTCQRAPVWLQKLGLEWAHRLATQPRRMWKRYAKTNPVFVWIVLKEYIKLKRDRLTADPR